MTNSKKKLHIRAILRRWLTQWRPVLVGFLAGALIFGLRACGSENASVEDAKQHEGHEEQATTWTCSMHPQIQQPESGSCPICGMDLIPNSSGAGNEDDGPGRVTLSPRAVKIAQLRTSPVRRLESASGKVRLLGRVEPNEKTLRNVTAWTGGRIDRLYVNTTGERVKGGQPIASLYSPEIYAAHQDLITAAAQLERMKDGAESSRAAANAALRASRQRLSLLGVPDSELGRMEKKTKPATSVSIRSPFSGTVMERFATEGSYVETGARLYSIANLDTLWIQLDAYESDLSLLSLEQKVRVEVEAYPGEAFDGVVTFIDPTLDERRRTSKVRVEVDNKDARLRPGMFAQAVVAAEKEEGAAAPLVVPASAPLFTGRRAIVYVEVPGGEGLSYDARSVRLGPRLGDVYPVVAGLKEGDRVVTRGAFALDADLQIRGGESMMVSPDDDEPGMWDDVVHLSRSELRTLNGTMAAYLAVQRALAADDLSLAQKAASKVNDEIAKVELKGPPGTEAAWAHVSTMMGSGARHVAQANSLEHARKGFEGLSGGAIMLLRTLGNPLDSPLVQAHCPMARGSQGASWVQEGEDLKNAYFGEQMLTCGDVAHQIEPGEHLAPPKKASAPAKSQPMQGHNH